MIIRLAAALAALTAALAALPPALAAEAGCGGDAYSSAQVTAGGRPGPITAVPETLCADLSGTRRTPLRLDLYAPAPASGADGATGTPAPYGDETRHSGPRRRDGSRPLPR
ncbi:conserved hypothetical protein [Methylobacterium sp. 4-46]|uniref:hypothetical protein n=1 Tax=unclassified Methylobacterium TaxID=2615210 RepID=UPI000152CB35|nr:MULTISPECIES: hypothetical protein [Methylobacterium]ACA19131.1 conserved hypothetical protein [Methylobacterium sp. 4-46]WFT78342.1 hypothetical protein QA634_24130 [Methylobacterium nodulans]